MPVYLDNDTMMLGDWQYFNNVWNKGQYANGQDYNQSMSFDAGSGMRVDWKWPPGEVVRAYPEVMLGQSPWTPAPSTTPQFPIRLADLDALWLSFDVDWSAQPDSNFNLAFEFWIASDVAGGEAAITNEVMIWIRSDFVPAGAPLLAYDDAMGRGTIYHTASHGDASGAVAQQWALTSLDYDTDLKSGTIDVAALLDQLVKNGLLNEQNYLMNAEFGAEVVAGSGSYTLHGLSVTYADGTADVLDLTVP